MLKALLSGFTGAVQRLQQLPAGPVNLSNEEDPKTLSEIFPETLSETDGP